MNAPTPSPLPRRRSRAARFRLAAGAVLILGAIVVLIVRANLDSMVYYSTVGELLARSDTTEVRGQRVVGSVVPGTVRLEGRRLSFGLTDGTQALPVAYEGVVPETFNEESEVVVQGSYRAGREFRANTVLTKCPSKYEGEAAEDGSEHPEGIPKTGS